MDARNALSPRTPEELCQDSFGLVVKGVGGCDGVERDLAEELAEPRVAEAAAVPSIESEGRSSESVEVVGFFGARRASEAVSTRVS